MTAATIAAQIAGSIPIETEGRQAAVNVPRHARLRSHRSIGPRGDRGGEGQRTGLWTRRRGRRESLPGNVTSPGRNIHVAFREHRPPPHRGRVHSGGVTAARSLPGPVETKCRKTTEGGGK